ncbi:hypothetical protein DFP72DRAFT_1175763 [Ephemerocybe angulata]|uniref:Uncharacterized protein n=1 Tax=Ephemerocybe angulata TaxID=980116 RepID=A0A8H6HGF4_9AGAR|nr:hypothetical protein DFP72DRAFT_1175763 [Tulosesus angulatus]
MLKCCTNLETFEESHSLLQSLYRTLILLPRLRTLRIRHTPDIDIDLLRYLQAPALLHLDVGLWEFWDGELDLLVTKFLEVSNACPALQSLRIPSDELRLRLSDLPSLKRLTLEQVTLEDDGLLFVDAYYGDSKAIR